jgi:hypothetical protein
MIRVIFKTIANVLEQQRTSFNQTTKQYLSQGKELLQRTANELVSISNREVPKESGGNLERFSLVSRAGILAAGESTHHPSFSSPKDLQMLADEFVEYAKMLDELKEAPERVFAKKHTARYNGVQRLAESVAESAREREPILKHY